jgi:hypothetical protein
MRRRRDQEEGQVFVALLLVFVALFFFALAFLEVGSAADQKTQTQSAGDSAAVSAGHELRDGSVSLANQAFSAAFSFGALFATVQQVTADPAAAACDAAQTNWNANTHASTLACGDLRVAAGTGAVTVQVLAPAGEVARGPVDVTTQQVAAEATARVVVGSCPPGAGAAKAAADWIVDRTAQLLGAPSLTCLTAADTVVLQYLDLHPQSAAAAIGPANLVVAAADKSFRTEIVR